MIIIYLLLTYVFHRSKIVAYFYEQNRNENSIFVDAGDIFFGGTMESEVTKGNITRDVYNILDPAVITFGNHEFDHIELLDGLTSTLPGKFISSNVFKKQKGQSDSEACLVENKESLNGITTYKIVTVGGKRILVLGLTTTDTDCILPSSIEGY